MNDKQKLNQSLTILQTEIEGLRLDLNDAVETLDVDDTSPRISLPTRPEVRDSIH